MSESPSNAIPFVKLGIPEALEARVTPSAPIQGRLAMARGLVPLAPEAQLGVLYVLAMDPDTQVAKAARAAISDNANGKTVVGLIRR